METAATHINGLYLRRRGGLEGLVVGFANSNMLADDPAQRLHQEHHGANFHSVFAVNVED